MNVVYLRNKLTKAEEKLPKKTASRNELNERLLALGLNPETEWNWIANNKVTHISIAQRVAVHLNVSQAAVMKAPTT